MKKLIALLLCMIMCLGMLASCGGNNAGGTASTPAAGNTNLVMGIEADIDNFDPFTNQQLVFVRTINLNCFEPLFHFDENMELVYDLATEYKQVDDVTYTFKLREGVKFHNGEAFTAEDVIHTINTIKDEATGAWRVSQFSNVASMTKTDDYNLEIKLSAPQANFIDNLAYTAIVSKSTTQDSLKTKPIGTGAFKFVSWTPNDSIKLTKNEEYWDAAKVKMSTLTLKVIPDSTVAVNSLKAGDVHLLGAGTVDTEIAKTITATEGLTLIEPELASTVYEVEVGRHNNPALADPEVMRALFLALDRQSIADTVFNGKAAPAKSSFPSAAKYYAEVDTEGYDLAKAKDVLSKTAYKDGFSFTVQVLSSDKASEQSMLVWQSDLKEIGVEMKIDVCEISVWLDAYLGRTYDMIANSYAMVGSDPSTYCSIIMTALADYQTKDLADLNAAINSGATGSDETKRAADYKTVQELIAKYRPVSSYVECAALNGKVSNLSGVSINAMGHIFFKNASFSA